ncbi:MAG: radical SAM protein [Clostridiales bacterium]|nr:radical SAM protein [Clostridiales bacterium]
MRYTHIYVERSAYAYPLTKRILSASEGSGIIDIDHYKDVFDRPRQDHEFQRKNPALILAVRTGARVFKGAPVCQSFGQRNFYYSSSIMNCPFDCEYCYLKGMYPSSYIVVFVNMEDYIKDVEGYLTQGPMYVCASYDTDLIALNPLTGLADSWCDLALRHEDLLVELRTKAAPPELRAIPNVIYAFTISPEEVASRYEKGAPAASDRIRAAVRALDSGCRVRLCFDPMIKIPGWRDAYAGFVEEVTAKIDLTRVTDVSVGTFRISGDYLSSMRKRLPANEIAWYPYIVKGGVAQYTEEDDKEMQDFMCGLLEEHIGREKIFTWN